MLIKDVPLFPLNTVLFPQMVLPLYIFEQRYRDMINECLKTNSPFGVILLEQGEAELEGKILDDVEPVVLTKVGTLARITEITRSPDGRMLITTIGTDRFRLLATYEVNAYMTADIEIFPEEPVDDPQMLDEARIVKRAFEGYLKLLVELAGKGIQEMDIPSDPQTLSYLVPHWLQINMNEKQRLLEAPDPYERLKAERLILQTETLFLEKVREMAVEEDDDKGDDSNQTFGYDVTSRFSKN